ncbi:MAG: hypothetical protein KGL39_19710 [Patescibacteria group bacterium]|nr:hypothetical protein [Patescibacteria group bacterium]
MTKIGMKRNPLEPRKSLKRTPFKRRNRMLRKIGKKGRKQRQWNKWALDQHALLQYKVYGTALCQLKDGRPDIFQTPCDGILVLEHVKEWRHSKQDLLETQTACWRHNQEKGSKELDCRTLEYKIELNWLADKLKK